MSNISSFLLSLHKIDCARQYKSKLSLHSLVLSLHKIDCTRQYKSKTFIALAGTIFA